MGWGEARNNDANSLSFFWEREALLSQTVIPLQKGIHAYSFVKSGFPFAGE